MIETDSTPVVESDEGVHPITNLVRWLRLPVIAGIVLGLLALEGGLRLLERRTGDLGILASTAATHARRLAGDADFDLVVIGSSSAGAGIWMPDLEASGVACDGYVAWLPSPNVADLESFVDRHVLATGSPDRIVVAITMREFVPPSPDDPPPPVIERSGDSWLERNVHLVRARPRLQDPFQFGLAIERGEIEEISSDGNQLLMTNRVIAGESAAHRSQERLRMSRYTYQSEIYERFAALLVSIQDAGVEPIVVNLPVTDEFIDLAPGGPSDHARYLIEVERSAVAASATFIDLSSVALDTSTQFADVNHLNASGRTTVTAALGAQLETCEPTP